MRTRRSSSVNPSTRTPIRRKPSFDVSITGLIYCSMMMFMALAAVNSQANLLFGVFGLMVGILLISILVSGFILRRIELTRVLPELAVVGEPSVIAYEFANKKRVWPSLSISIAEMEGTEAFMRQPVAYLLHAAPRMTATVSIEVLPKRRGLHELGRYQLSTSFPFGFIKRALDQRQVQELLIYPALGKVDSKVLEMCRSADAGGSMMRPRRGGMDEFYGLKEHRQGENPRFIYWKRSARTGVLVAKEMTQVSPPRLLLLVDTFIRERTIEAHAAVERTIAMAASLASEGLAGGLSVGLCAWSDGWLSVTPNHGKRHRRDLLALLARLPLNSAHDSIQLLDASHNMIKSGTTAVLLTPHDVAASARDASRGMIVLSAQSPQSREWFKFPDTVDFNRCMPAEEEPRIRGR
jgi:uncharacterized protein (DUF58 family)